MSELSRGAEKILKTILENRNENGVCDTEYWKDRFNNENASDNVITRGYFKELIDFGMITVMWGDNYPYMLNLLGKGATYFEDKCRIDAKEQNITNNFYGPVNDSMIQQGTVNSMQIRETRSMNYTKIDELIQTVRKYDAILEDEYGAEASERMRDAVADLEKTEKTGKDDDKIKSILNYMRELSINAGGGLIAAGILQIISMVV